MEVSAKCPQCGSRDLIKIRPRLAEGQIALRQESNQYKCQLCGRNFNYTPNPSV